MHKDQSAAQRSPRLRYPIDFGDESVSIAWEAAHSLLLSAIQPDGLGALLPKGRRLKPRFIQTALLARRASVSLPLLIAATRECAVSRALAAAVQLIGAGPGLTPSWDDLLVDYICGLRVTLTVEDRKRALFLDQFGLAIHQASSRTTDVSRRYIERTVRGEGPAWIEDVLHAIALGDLERAQHATRPTMNIGTTSGTDMMLGAVLGSAAWQLGAQAIAMLATLSCHRLPIPGSLTSEDHVAH